MGTLYQIAVEALKSENARVEMISSNMVNAVTPGYKRGLLTGAVFANKLDHMSAKDKISLSAPSTALGSVVGTDFTPGALNETGNPHHIAIQTNGFFEVRAGNQVLYTRAGVFHSDERGRLVTSQGHILQGESGDVVTSTDQFRLLRDGTLIEGDRAITRLKLVDFQDKRQLSRVGGAAFEAGNQQPFDVKAPAFRQGFLEASNVTTGAEMVQLMEALKRFEFGQKIVHSQDDMMDRAIRRIGDNQ